MKKKEGFGSKIGFVLAAAGSAVGLGNIWRFPYLAAKYGGGIFLLIYLILTVTFGFALMVTEIALGRKTGKSVIGAYKQADERFSFLGFFASAVPIIIEPYYCVIGGWTLKYFLTFISSSYISAANDDYFSKFTSEVTQPTAFFLIFALASITIVMIGVQKGIEAVSKFMMPLLIVISIVIAIYTMTRPGAIDGLKFYFLPNVEGFTAGTLLKTIIAAVGQIFFSLSVAMGIMVTYGSYMKKEFSIKKSARQIEFFDTMIAFLAGMTIVPAVFIFSGGNAAAINAGPGLMFVTLPKVFASMRGGQAIGILFFALVFLAALTSSVSLLETIVSILLEKFKLTRIPATLYASIIILIFGMLSVFGYSIWSEFTIAGYQFLDFFDFISNNILMPIVALLTCILFGYFTKTDYVISEMEANGEHFKGKKMYTIMIKYICPICMIIILLVPFFVKF